jgi:hypothetical protein
MGVSIEGQVGPRYVNDGGSTELRQSRFGGLVVTDAHGKYYEAVSRGNVFCAANTAAQATSTASATATGLILSNPAGSGKYLSILDIVVGVGAAVAAAFEVGLFANLAFQTQAAVTHTTPITVRNALIGSGNAGVGLVDSAATLPAAPTHIRTLLASGWVTATAQSQELIKDEVAGVIMLLPNTAVSIQSVLGTQSIIASMTWEEIVI